MTTKDVTRFNAATTHIHQPEPKGLISWWQDAKREGYFSKCEEEAPRMHASRAYQLVGIPQVIGQLDRTASRG